MMLFSKQIGSIIGDNLNKLFGLKNVSLRRTEIYIEDTKGFNCSYNDKNKSDPWVLGRLVLENFAKVNLSYLIFLITINLFYF
jgi:hypothetical protein